MTDNEIIKALECCQGVDGISYCSLCLMYEVDNCVHILSEEAKGLINRQKEEIEKYKGVIKTLEDDVRLAKIETVKDFGKLLIDKIDNGVITHSFDIVDLVADEVERIEKGR